MASEMRAGLFVRGPTEIPIIETDDALVFSVGRSLSERSVPHMTDRWTATCAELPAIGAPASTTIPAFRRSENRAQPFGWPGRSAGSPASLFGRRTC